MIVLFTVLRLLAILIVSHDMSGLLKTWKSKCWFIAGSLLLSLFVGGITGSLLALLFCYLFLNKISSSEKNSFLFTFLPWVFVEVTSKLLQLYFFPWIFQINYLQVKDTPVLIALSYLLIYPIFHLIVKVFFIDFGALNVMGNNHIYQVRQRLLVGVTLAYIILSLIIFYASNILALNPMHSKVACANMQSGCLDICEIHDNELSRINEVHMTTPRVKFNRHRPKGRGLTHPVTYSRNNLFGFCDLAVSENYIFALYSGRTLKDYNLDVDKGKTIVVFDWNGLHVRTYQLQNACSAISYDAADNTIYALSQEGNKPQIITLNL